MLPWGGWRLKRKRTLSLYFTKTLTKEDLTNYHYDNGSTPRAMRRLGMPQNLILYYTHIHSTERRLFICCSFTSS